MLNQTIITRLALAVLTLTLAACNGEPRRKFTMFELAGRWQLQPEGSPALLARMGRVPIDSHLVLSADGSFTAVDMPLEEFPDLKPFRLHSGKGKWRLSPYSDRSVDVYFADKDGGNLQIDVDSGGEPRLLHEVGMPESDERWVWKKVRN